MRFLNFLFFTFLILSGCDELSFTDVETQGKGLIEAKKTGEEPETTPDNLNEVEASPSEIEEQTPDEISEKETTLISENMELTKDTVIQNRKVVLDMATIKTFEHDFFIMAEEFISNHSIIQNFPEGQKAKKFHNGKAGGNILIETGTAKGELQLILSEERERLVLSDVLENRKIAYFQMNVNGYGDISRRIGRIILQDLKVLSNQIQAGQRHFQYDFCACFVDEFGSFATQDFADFLKMARSSRIGIHLFCQGLADLKAITPEFKEQIIGNTSRKIIFRQDVPEDAELWSSIAGTFSSKKRTFQISGSETEEELTGIGSLREVKEMRIEFDVFKKLSPGQAVLIDKARHKEDLLKVWRAKGRRARRRKRLHLPWVDRRIEAVRQWLAEWKEATPHALRPESEGVITASEGEEASRLEWERHMESLEGLREKPCEREGLRL